MARPGSPVATLRSWLFWFHLSTGAVAGAAIFTMSITGALLAMQPQILAWLERDQRRVSSNGQMSLPPSRLIDAAVGDQRPESLTLTLSADPTEAAVVSLGRDSLRYVDPYRAVVTGEGARTARRAFQWLTEFHRWFAVPLEWRPAWRAVTGWSTFGFVVLVASGVFLWIPRTISRDSVRRALSLSWPGTAKARHFNWHTVVGIWCAPILLVLALTGVVLAFPWANRLVFTAAGTPLPAQQARSEGGPRPQGARRPDGAAVPDYRQVDRAVVRAAEQMPTWSTMAVRIQGSAEGPLSFTITDATHWNRFARSQLTIAGKSGAIVRWEPYADVSRGQRWRGWIRFAHTGELGGSAGQALAGLASAGGALLAWTGVSLSLRRWAAARARKQAITTGAPFGMGEAAGADQH